MPGDVLGIKAGIGAFSKASQPVISVNGKTIELGDEGYAFTKMKVPQKPGKYKILVSVSFTNPTTGKKELSKINVKYEVVKPCND